MALVVLIGFLMVSTWRFWSGKELDLSGRHPFRVVIVLAAVVGLLVVASEYVLLLVGLTYLGSGLLARGAYSWQRRRTQPPSKTPGEIRTV
jgi:CDP-diacylglycerol--serine O-phosphatidyltransferase